MQVSQPSLMHDFTPAHTIITQALSFLEQQGYDTPVASIGSGRIALDDEATRHSEVLSILYANKKAKRTIQIDYDCGVLKLSPVLRTTIMHQEGLRILSRFELSSFLEQHCGRLDAYRKFSGFWSGLPRLPISTEEECKFISNAMALIVPTFKEQLQATLSGAEWPKVKTLPR